MSIQAEIQDPGTGTAAKVSDEGALHVITHPHPPFQESLFIAPFRQFFTDTGVSTGDQDMLVTGSAAAPLEFFITASETQDIYIKTVQLVIADAGATLNDFGNIAALTNGIEFRHQTQAGEVVLHEGIKTNFDAVSLANGTPSFGDGVSAFRANNVIGNSEAYIPVIDFASVYGMAYGLRLRKGTKDRLVFCVRDDVSGLDRLDVLGAGLTF